MFKKEVVWREILNNALAHKIYKGTQKEIARKYGFSLSTVFNALSIPRQIGAVSFGGKGFEVSSVEKLLYLWATLRNLKKDIIYQTAVLKNIREIEGEIPPGTVLGAFSAFKRKYGEIPADYDKVYVYIKEKDLEKIKNRFPQKAGYNNLIVLKADAWLESFREAVPDCQIFVDLWNLSEWYAKDYIDALKQKILK
ncbi:MAG: hypothetical protein Q8N88_03430 [Nanoarchaeota archaeon]|nr:hypothetical protein [Nanoarchaeota archaeon]